MKYNSEIHHRHSIRLKGYDYSQAGLYFITICTKNQECMFGKIKNGEIFLSEIGNIARQYWNEIPEHSSIAGIDTFIIMPNHMHGIIILNNNDRNIHRRDVANFRRDVTCNVPTMNATDVRTLQCNVPDKNEYIASISPKQGTLSAIIRSYKSAVTKFANENYPDLHFGWQSRFYEHIIRDNGEHQRISNYITNNPVKWKDDKFYS